MGLFDKIKANLAEANRRSQVHNEMNAKEREADANRPSITALNFQVLDPAIANDPRYTNSGYVKKVGVEDFLECIRSGRAEYAEVVVVTSCSLHVDTESNPFSDDNTWIYRVYGKVADLSGAVYREIVITAKDDYISEWAYHYWDEQYTNPDPVSPAQLPHAYILHYSIQNAEQYLLVDQEEFDDLSKVFLRLKNRTRCKCLELDNSRNCWWE